MSSHHSGSHPPRQKTATDVMMHVCMHLGPFSFSCHCCPVIIMSSLSKYYPKYGGDDYFIGRNFHSYLYPKIGVYVRFWFWNWPHRYFCNKWFLDYFATCYWLVKYKIYLAFINPLMESRGLSAASFILSCNWDWLVKSDWFFCHLI